MFVMIEFNFFCAFRTIRSRSNIKNYCLQKFEILRSLFSNLLDYRLFYVFPGMQIPIGLLYLKVSVIRALV